MSILKVSVNGGDPVPAESVVMFDASSGQPVPFAGAIVHGNVVFFADSIRDASEFRSILDNLGISADNMHKFKGVIEGSLR